MSKPKKGSELELTVQGLAFGGKGIGEMDGFKLFIPDVAPGDQIQARVTKVKSRYGEARALKILKPSPQRVNPRCKHFDTCGGCKWQFISYEDQLAVKEQHVRDALERIGGLDVDVLPIIPNDSPWFYRNKMELSFGPGSDEHQVMLGFYPPGYHYEVFDLETCFLQSELVAELAQKVRTWANANGVPHYRSDTHEGVLRNLIIREGKNTGEVMVILVTSTSVFEHRESFIALFENDPRITSLYWNTVYQVPGQPTWIEENLLKGKAVLTESLKLENGQILEFDILPQAFFQTNTRQAEKLYTKVMDLAELTGEEVVFDLYCGTGTIGLFCAHKAKQVVGVELNESAVDSARNNALKNGIKNASFYLGAVEKRLASLDQKPDVVIVDPPRAGLGDPVVDQVGAFGAKRVVYVSCNPTSFARDAKKFEELGYTLKSVQPVDMFPQTYHVELVSVFEEA